MPFLVLGEALVDLICEQPADGIGDATAFVPHFGGAAANGALARGAQSQAGARATESWGAVA